jgi:hypothetical protein
MKRILVTTLVGLACAILAGGCATGAEEAEEDETLAAEEPEEVGTSEAAVGKHCGSICATGAVAACARFGTWGGVACGLTTIGICNSVCAKKASICTKAQDIKRPMTGCARKKVVAMDRPTEICTHWIDRGQCK